MIFMLAACQSNLNDKFSFEGVKLGDAHKKIIEKYPSVECEKNQNFHCILKDEKGGVRFTFDSAEKLIAIEHYWMTKDISFGQILKAYEDKFGKPTKELTYKYDFRSDYIWCKDKECNVYRSLTFNTPNEKMCSSHLLDDFYENESCKNAQLVLFTTIKDKEADDAWYEKKDERMKNVK